MLICNDCKMTVQGFINDKLDGQIEKFITFNISHLESDVNYGKGSEKNFDSDNSVIMKAIYCLLWRDILTPDKACLLSECGTGKNYRGDAINSFSASFGLTDYDVNSKTSKFKKMKMKNPNISDDELRYHRAKQISCNPKLLEAVAKFDKERNTIGNYIVLPNKAIEVGKVTQTINQYRGFSCFRDYFDRFLLVLQKQLDDDKAEGRWKGLFEKNYGLFPFVKKTSFKIFADKFYLDKFYLNKLKIDKGYIDKEYIDKGYIDVGYVDNNIIDSYSETYPWSPRGRLTEKQASKYIGMALSRNEARSKAMITKFKELGI